MDTLAIAGQGLSQATQQFEKAAIRLSNAASPEDGVSLSDSAVAMLMAKNLLQAQVATTKVANEMEKKTLDLFA